MIYSGVAPPERFNLARYCLAEKPTARTALIFADSQTRQWTYGELEDVVLRMAEGLRRRGLGDRQRILLRLPNGPDFALLFLAATAAGAVPVPASPMLTAPEVAVLIAAVRPAAMAIDGLLPLPETGETILLGPDAIAALKQAPGGDYAPTMANDPAYIIFTSGTGGTPRGVIHGHRTVWGRRPMYRGWYGIGETDVMLHTGTLNWTYTMGTGLIDPLANGATAVLYDGPRDNRVWQRLIATHGVTIFASVPGLYRQILRGDFKPLESLRHGLTAGEALAVSLHDRWREATGLPLYEALGMSEISTYVSSGPDVPTKPGSPGKPQPGRSVTILADGQIGVHTSDPGLLLSYLDGEVPTGEWFATGDAGRFDQDGYLWHEGRIDDVMNASGYRVSPIEVETALLQHPVIEDAGVREVRISDSLSIIGAFVVPKPGTAPEDTEILAFARERLAHYKCPKQVWFLARLPRNANGKLLRKALTAGQ